MISIQLAKDTIAKKHSLKDWKYVLHLFLSREINILEYQTLENEAFQLYASECCKQQREACAQSACTEMIFDDLGQSFGEYRVDKESILECPLVVEVK
jgi:hypothetical protein